MDEETSQDNNGATFLKNNDKIEENDTVCVYVDLANQYSIVVKRGQTLHMKYGALRHEFLIGKSYGVPISATAGYIYVLRANPTLWTRTLPKRTQILYTPDIGTILLLLDIKPGSIVCETGTGSGSLTHAIATCVAPTGHVYSYDVDASRVNSVQNDIKAHGLANNATIIERDVYAMGFDAVNCDAIFLDLPCPWPLIEKCKMAFSAESGGRLVNFSPCIEQVQRVAEELERHGFIEIQTVELVPQKMKAVEVPTEKYESVDDAKKIAMGLELETTSEFDEPILDLIPFPSMQPTHTGYLTSATFLPS